MIHFDDVLTAAYRIITNDAVNDFIEEVLVLRDLRGRIRLFMKPVEGHESEVEEALDRLSCALATDLGPFWGNLIEVDSPRSDYQSILKPVRADRQPIEPQTHFSNWWIIERHAAKSAWTARSHKPPWPLVESKTPAIVAFYSHKGGVGRTTSLCAAATQLAQEGKKVAVVDLDLEAPGLGSLLVNTPFDYGVVDYLLERVLAGNTYAPDLSEFVIRQVDPLLIGESGEPIVCMPAGKVSKQYLEKLSRLDYELLSNYADESKSPLGDLLRHVKREYNPEHIFLDCRAGLHDLGGLAVERLSHANVILGLDSDQSWLGLQCLLASLGSVTDPPPCMIVQAMEWPTPDERRRESRERFLDKAYAVFAENFYDEDDVPDIGSQDDAHYPFHVPYIQALAGYQDLRDVAELLKRELFPEFVERLKGLVSKAMSND